MAYLHDARERSIAKIAEVVDCLKQAEDIVGGHACVYATGSFGRLEAGEKSDLDLFIVINTHEEVKDSAKIIVNSLSGISEIKLKMQLIEAVEANEIAEFDGDGRYLESHRFDDYTKWLGTREDDFRNTLTGRLLLLLESKCLVGEVLYCRLIDSVVEDYFKDFPVNSDKFIPAFLVNDILRMWRTFCVNYESRRKKGNSDSRIKNLKLKYSRMLTCYSAILWILHIYVKNGTVSPDDIKMIVSKTPTERLECVQSDCHDLTVKNKLKDLSESYGLFLSLVHKDKDAALKDFVANEAEWKERSYQFGRDFASTLSMINALSERNNALYRMIVI